MADPKPFVLKKKSSGKNTNKNTNRSPSKSVKNLIEHIPYQYYEWIRWLAINHKKGFEGKSVPKGKTANDLRKDEDIIKYIDYITKKQMEQIQNDEK